MRVEEIELCGGACRMICTQTDKFKRSSLTLLACNFSCEVDRVKNAVLLDVLLRGCEKYRTIGSINRHLDMLYSTNVSLRRTGYYGNSFFGANLDYLDSSYTYDGTDLEAAGLDLIGELFFHPLLDVDGMLLESYVEQEKQNLVSAVNSRVNNPKALAHSRCRELLRMGERGFIGDEELLARAEKLDRAELTRYYRELFSSCSFVCFYVGSATDAAVAHVSAFLEDISRYTTLRKLPERFFVDLPTMPERVKRGTLALDVSQCKLSLAYRVPFALGAEHTELQDICAMKVLDALLGGSTSSKLFTVVREEMGLCYYCSSSYSAYYGVLSVDCGIDSSDLETAEREIDAQLELIKQGSITETELENAKRYLIFGYGEIDDSPQEIEGYYMWRRLFGEYTTHDEFAEMMNSVTAADVVRVARKIVKGAAYTVVGRAEDEAWEAE